MRGNWFVLFVLFAFLTVIVAIVGCSLIGLGIGAIADSHAKRSMDGWQVVSIMPGTKIGVIKKNGQHLTGEYTGIDREPAGEYALRVGRASQEAMRFNAAPPSGAGLPTPGDEIRIFDVSGVEYGGTFVGFDREYAGVELETPPRSMTLEIFQKSTAEFVDVELSTVTAVLDSRGNTFNGVNLCELAHAGMIPELPALKLKNNGIETLIALDEVNQIEAHIKTHKGKVIGFVVGAVVDAVVILIAATSSSSETATVPDSGWASCPSVYSFDGERYVLDSETYGGAIFESAQRTDWDNLDYLREVRGVYRLKLANELEETQFIDELKLLVVDHPRGTRVIPSFTGQLHTVSAPRPPITAVAQNGANVLELVRAKDDQVWMSNPFGRNPDDQAEGRDAIELEFPRPPRADTAKLVFNVQNTWWASYLQGQMLTLHGHDLGEWYALMNSSAVARDALKQAMIREGMLLIKIWNRENWQDAGFVWEVGPSVPKDVVVQLDLGGMPDGPVRLKIESTVGFWIVNSVEVDYTSDIPVQVSELFAEKAVDHLGADWRDVLRESDGSRYVMAVKGEWAEIKFTAPPPPNSLSRSFILKSTGYYTFHTAGDGEPQKELFTRLMTEPGAYGQYTLRLLHEELAAAGKQIEKR